MRTWYDHDVYCDDMMPDAVQHRWRSHAVYKGHKKPVSWVFTKEGDCFLAGGEKIILLLFFAYCHSLFMSVYYFVLRKTKVYLRHTIWFGVFKRICEELGG